MVICIKEEILLIGVPFPQAISQIQDRYAFSLYFSKKSIPVGISIVGNMRRKPAVVSVNFEGS
jgi:hypothetical protein